jgi:hypothetical protein
MTASTDFTAITYGPCSLILLRGEHAEARKHLQALIEGLEGNGFSVGVA